MNEKFKQLAEQAEILIGKDSYGKFAVIPGHEKDPISRLGKAESYNALEKFAELIVKECYVHCGGQLMDKTFAEAHGLTYNDGVMDCAIGLLQHFGVEE